MKAGVFRGTVRAWWVSGSWNARMVRVLECCRLVTCTRSVVGESERGEGRREKRKITGRRRKKGR